MGEGEENDYCKCCLYLPEAESLKNSFIEVLGIILRVLKFEVSVYNVYITN